jgi:SAM-dependent methyltransferase
MHQCKGKIETISCGCQVERCYTCEGARSLRKCTLHKPHEHNSQYYYLEDLHGQSQGIPHHTKTCAEFELVLEEIGFKIPIGKPEESTILDIGAGIGIYAPMFLRRGYRYEALELDPWACKYIKGAYTPYTHNTAYENLSETLKWDNIIAGHVLEHFKDAPAMLRKMFRTLNPGGYLYLLIPDDTDLGNPDHLWFFKEATIRQWLFEVGFTDIHYRSKKVVIYENFIYCVARKPE